MAHLMVFNSSTHQIRTDSQNLMIYVLFNGFGILFFSFQSIMVIILHF